MPNVTEKDIIEFLEKKLNFYYSEVKRIKDILYAINENYLEISNNPFENPSAIMYQTRGVNKVLKKKNTAKALIIPENYRPQLSFSRKIAFVLNRIQTGIKEEIAEQIVLLQPELDINRVTKHLSTVLSDLKSKNLLTTTKHGRKYRYSLAKPEQDTDDHP